MGPFGFGNLGDAAIQQAMLQHLYDRYPQATILGFSLNPEDTEKRHHIKTYPVGRMSSYGWAGKNGTGNTFDKIYLSLSGLRFKSNKLIRLFYRVFLSVPLEIMGVIRASRWLRGMDAFIVSGGGQLDEYWGGAWHHPYTLFVWALLAKMRGVKFKVVSVGKGSLDAALSRWFVRKALGIACYRSYRDQETKDLVNQIGFQNDDPVYTDLAYSLQAPAQNGTTNSEFRGTIGIGPMAYFDPRVWPEKDKEIYNGYLNKLAEIAVWLVGQNFAIRFFPGECVHDHPAIQEVCALIEKYAGALRPGQLIYEPVDTVDALMDQLHKTDVVIASRFHGVLLSQLIYKPVIALSYHSKVAVLMNETGQQAYCFPIESFSVEAVIEQFQRLWLEREQIQSRLKRYIDSYWSLLDRQYELVFADL